MAKVILICGKIASGKTHLAHQLLKEENTVLLSCDELMLKLFPEDIGSDYDMYSMRAREYLHDLSEQFVQNGTNVILDWGFWKSENRKAVTERYRAKGIECEWHYLDVAPEVWAQHIEKRNSEVKAGITNAYFVDEGLLAKVNNAFETPLKEEMDVWHNR